MPHKQSFFSKLGECFGAAFILLLQIIAALVLFLMLPDRHH